MAEDVQADIPETPLPGDDALRGAETDEGAGAEVVVPEIVKDDRSRRLEEVFQGIYDTSMQDVPICNKELQVEAIAHGAFETEWLGVLVTPWCMNLMLLPTDETEGWDERKTGEKFTYTFPSGRYEFISGKDDNLGLYRMCSLFSPMYEFSDHESALATAALALEAVMAEPDEDEEVNEHEMEMAAIMAGAVPADMAEPPEYVEPEDDEELGDGETVIASGDDKAADEPELEEGMDADRRALLTGRAPKS